MARNKYDVDETLETKFDMKQIKRLFSYVGRYRKKLIMTIMLMLFSSALGMVIPVLMQRVMDIYIPNHDKKGILLMAALAALIILATAYILRIKIKWTSQIGQGIIHELRRELFIHLEELPFSYYDSRPHGKIQVRIVNYVNNISDLLSNGIVNTITDCCSLFFILGFMFYYSVPLTLICMCGLPILLAIVLFVKKKQRRGWQLASNKQSNLNAYIAESINGVRVTQAFVREDKNLGIFNNLSGSYRKAWMSVIKYNFMIGPTVQFISILATAAVYWVGIHWIMGGNDIISVGALTALTIYISQFWNPINTLASFYNSLLTAISYLERIFETIDEPVNVKDAPGAVEMPPIKGEVEFSHVVFSYEPGVRILNDVNFKANVGDSFAIVGPTGAGKTLSSLRFALYHAKKMKKQHIIYIAPFNSILIQNAEEIRKAIGKADVVLEHHCNVVCEEGEEDQYRKLTETWDSPIIVTTAVQILNTLFSAQKSCIRRMHTLCNSIIIFDEVQAIPVKCMELFNLAVNFLTQFCGTTVVLCSATQPTLAPIKENNICECIEMAGRPEKYANAFKRTDIKDATELYPGGMEIEDLSEFVKEKTEQYQSTLVILNTTACAMNTF